MSAQSSGTASVGAGNTFKDFEKKTYDVWDIDDENPSYSLSGINDYVMPISLLVSQTKKFRDGNRLEFNNFLRKPIKKY